MHPTAHAHSQTQPARSVQARNLRWLLIIVLGVAALLRVWNLDTWSMWEDEEGSLNQAQRPYQGYAGFFPVFFLALKQFLGITGLSVGGARMLPAFMGLLSVALTFVCFRRWVSPSTALLAALLVAVNLGHLFWSQSIRYYTTLLVFQMLSMYWFFEGFEKGNVAKLVLSNLALILALLTHFSALLLAPVFIGYLALMIWQRETAGGYRLRNYLVFGLPLGLILGVFMWRSSAMVPMFEAMGAALASERNPVRVGMTVLAYFGAPLVVLGLLAPCLARDLPRRTLLFLLVASIIPVLELLVIAQLKIINVTWYYGLIALVSFALLAAAGLTTLWRRQRRLAAGMLGVGTVLYYGVFLFGYYTIMHGDRPRWEEAAAYLERTAGVRCGVASNPPVFANVPGVIAFYLGADPRLPESYRFVQRVPKVPPPKPGNGVTWYVMEAMQISPEYKTWFAANGKLRARFEAVTGPVDRSVLVYQCDGAQAAAPAAAAPCDGRTEPPASGRVLIAGGLR